MGQTYRCQIWILHYLTFRGDRSGGEKVTLFDSDCYDGVSAGKGVMHTEVTHLGAKESQSITEYNRV